MTCRNLRETLPWLLNGSSSRTPEGAAELDAFRAHAAECPSCALESRRVLEAAALYGTHPSADELMDWVLAGEPSSASRDASGRGSWDVVGQHLEACSECREEVARLQASYAEISTDFESGFDSRDSEVVAAGIELVTGESARSASAPLASAPLASTHPASTHPASTSWRRLALVAAAVLIVAVSLLSVALDRAPEPMVMQLSADGFESGSLERLDEDSRTEREISIGDFESGGLGGWELGSASAQR